MITLKTENWQINDIETILLDKDGTFIDLHFFWGKMTELRCKKIIDNFNLQESCFNNLCLCLGYNPNTKKMLSDGITALYPRSTIIKIFKDDLKKFNIETTEEKIAEIFDEVSHIFYQNMVEYTKPIETAIDFIKKAHSKGIKLGIVTSDSLESTKLTLKHFGWEYLFNSVIGRECSNETKESGALTKIALAELKANPKTTIMIGDAPMDAISATNAGIKNTILVATGQIEAQELKKHSNYVLNSLNELTIQN